MTSCDAAAGRRDVLYLTHDGITDHIGRSQIAPYLLGLAAAGYRLHVLSVEKPGHEALVAEYRERFAAADINWTTLTYSNTFSFGSFVAELFRLHRAAARIIQAEGIQVLHCRCFPATLVGEPLSRRYGLKLIFDFRDFWPDTRLETRRFKLPYHLIKRQEPRLIRGAAQIVTLTARARDILIDRHLRDLPDARARFQVIPCCADFDHFDPAALSAEAREAARQRAGVEPGQFVLLYLGSLGADYLLDQMLAVFRQVLLLRPDACFLFVSNNGAELVTRRAAELGLPAAQIRFVSADRREVPALISLASLSVVFIRPSLSKAGCSPTKLAELFALNVPVLANTGVGDLDAIIAPARNGSVIVEDFQDATLRTAVEQVLAAREAAPVDIRAHSREFSLAAGVRHYQTVYDRLLTQPSVKETQPC